jgi:hypothetical protein
MMLPDRLSGYLAYFEQLASQPTNRWEGFATTGPEGGTMGLPAQLAFPCYALAALAHHADADADEQARCRATMAALIGRMIQRRVWAAWGLHADRIGISPDPVWRGNLSYSGHLAMMLGVYETAGGDMRFDEDFTLLWTNSERFCYSHHSLMQGIADQMQSSAFHGLESAPGLATTRDMAHALWAARLHDAKHGSEYSALADPWLSFMSRRLLVRGLLSKRLWLIRDPLYTRSRRAAPWGNLLNDAWSLALLLPLAPALAEPLAPRLLARTRAQPDGTRVLHCPRRLVRQGTADTALTTAFAYLVAIEAGHPTADALLAYADAHLGLTEDENGARRCSAAAAPSFATALFALGEAGGMGSLLTTTG